MKKDLAVIGGLFLVVAVLIIFGRGYSTAQIAGTPKQSSSSASTNQNVQKNETDVTLGDLQIKATIVDTADERKKGLGKRDELPIGDGMLFVFDKSDIYSIWMKDMRFPIDIIWIEDLPAGEKKIVDISENALAEPGKKDNELKVYRPNAQARYILEMNAGLVKLHNLKVGDTVNFEL